MANHPIFAPTFHGKVARVKELFDDDPSLVTILDAKGQTPVDGAQSHRQHAVIKILDKHASGK